MSEQEIYIKPGECLPGFPSGHGPGLYLVDYELRTIRPVPVEQPVEPTPGGAQPEITTDAQPAEEPQIEEG